MLKLMHKKFSIFFILSFLSINLIGSSYWQQKVKYKINISFDVNNNQFSGTEEIIYYKDLIEIRSNWSIEDLIVNF